ncbi:transducin family protein / WD-40 repeat family protein [Zea mays]|uniref:Transducin family protein / WD-40 repeat family protein n=1 Tax=Zea mays TaxID=4577 RepID=A0A1D6MZY6_MAIZE|nr:transducin family protein / WD-40 repeat family protein [Zea mays]ONM34133.1 transducin family protein / WD-40 repeat family protein [Zea mays]
MWNADHNAILNTFAGHSNTVTCGDFTPDGKLICTGSDDASLRIWDPRSAQSRHVVRGHGYHSDGLTCLSMTSDSQTVVSGSKDSSVHIVNLNSGQVVSRISWQMATQFCCRL